MLEALSIVMQALVILAATIAGMLTEDKADTTLAVLFLLGSVLCAAASLLAMGAA